MLENNNKDANAKIHVLTHSKETIQNHAYFRNHKSFPGLHKQEISYLTLPDVGGGALWPPV